MKILRTAIGRLEQEPRVLAVLKLGNVGLAMLWGFAVTFVFVRLLPIAEFRAFLLLVAFANFTVSADFGFSGIIYARLRRFRLEGGAEDFHPRDIAVLLAFMMAVVLLGGVLIAGGIATGQIPTERPGLFLAFYLLTAANIFGILVKRALAALDHNLLWELVDAVRRLLSVALLIAALAGVPILLSVCIQIGLAVAALVIGLAVVHRSAGMRGADWWLRGVAIGTVWRTYMRDMGTTMTLTLSDVLAYTAPYFGIAMVTPDPRPLLIFDFIYKISRALTAVIRALVEAALPRLTAAFHDGRTERVRQLIGRIRLLALGAAAALGLVLLVTGGMLSDVLFDGKAVLTVPELLALAALLCGLSMLCVSTYVHNGVGRFTALLPTSLAFLLLSVLSIVAGAWASTVTGQSFALCFAALYAAVHLALAVRHQQMLSPNDARMKLVMADPSLFTGRYDDGLCAALARAGHQVTLAGRPLRSTDAIVPKGYAYRPRFFRWSEALPGGGKVRQGAKAAEYLASAMAGSRAVFAGAEVVHWQWLPFARADGHWLRRLSTRHALVHTVHNAKPFHGDGAKEAMQGSGYFDLLRRFDALIVHGEETRAVLEQRGISVPVSIVPHPPMMLASADTETLAAVPPSPRPRILFFGTIKPYKGFDLLIDAALTLWGEGADFDLTVAGQPFMAIDPLIERVRAAGFGERLILDLGFLTEQRLDAHLHRADIIAFPYRHIDSSGAFLSACHYGAAMVTSDSGMFARLPEGAATRFPAGDAGALADALRPLVLSHEARDRAGAASLQLGTRLGNWDEAAELTAAVYRQAAAAARHRGIVPGGVGL